MAYVVLQVKSGWSLRHDRYEEGKRVQRRVPKKEYPHIGFREEMTIEEARERAHQLSAEEWLRKKEERRQRIQERLKGDETRRKALLPLQASFESLLSTPRDRSEWAAAQDTVVNISVQLEHWKGARAKFYDYFLKQGLSPDWTWRVLKMVNRYGEHVAEAQNRFFKPIPMPRGHVRQKLTDGSKKLKAVPIRPWELEEARSKFEDYKHYNWLYVTVWLGLRPAEADVPCQVTKIDGYKVAVVYQPKLISVKKEDRLKYIPAITAEQEKAIDILSKGDVKRPLKKTISKYLGDGRGQYSGRNGFVKLMKSLGRDLEEISAWMGHKDINRTRNDYEEKGQLIMSKKANKT